LVRLEGDHWWLGTVILFGPIWVTLLPLAVLVPGAAFLRRRSLIPLTVGGVVSFFLLMGLCIPWRAVLEPRGIGKPTRVLSCNVHGKSALNRLIAASNADILLIQEWPGGREKPPADSGPWYLRRDGELVIASRYPIVDTEVFTAATWSDWGGSAARYTIAAPQGRLKLINLHLASPHRPFDALKSGTPGATDRLEQYLAVRAEQSRLISKLARESGGSVLLAGDFNTPCEGRVYHQFWSDFPDAFTVAGFGLGHTYFAHGACVRIDHVLCGSAWHCRDCWVGPDVGSPHRPLIADLDRTSAE
jgi:endonuclease/exonuclease/phosphatase (EEP) superfamily protein YafD